MTCTPSRGTGPAAVDVGGAVGTVGAAEADPGACSATAACRVRGACWVRGRGGREGCGGCAGEGVTPPLSPRRGVARRTFHVPARDGRTVTFRG
ncbi:hypothetical protein AGMMS50218_13680 [Actinomycetota bacterium]|nr:hypothetical protein AGMMS50218_13680 [Actinomycetota bacterium]